MKSFKNILGEEIKTLVSSKQSSETFTQFVIRTPIGLEVPIHQPLEAYNNICIIKDNFEFNRNGPISVLTTGGSICIPSQTAHKYKNISNVIEETIATHVPGGMDIFFDTIASEKLSVFKNSERIKELAQQTSTILI